MEPLIRFLHLSLRDRNLEFPKACSLHNCCDCAFESKVSGEGMLRPGLRRGIQSVSEKAHLHTAESKWKLNYQITKEVSMHLYNTVCQTTRAGRNTRRSTKGHASIRQCHHQENQNEKGEEADANTEREYHRQCQTKLKGGKREQDPDDANSAKHIHPNLKPCMYAPEECRFPPITSAQSSLLPTPSPSPRPPPSPLPSSPAQPKSPHPHPHSHLPHPHPRSRSRSHCRHSRSHRPCSRRSSARNYPS